MFLGNDDTHDAQATTNLPNVSFVFSAVNYLGLTGTFL